MINTHQYCFCFVKLFLQDECGGWTKEKHNLYLDSLENSFVEQGVQSNITLVLLFHSKETFTDTHRHISVFLRTSMVLQLEQRKQKYFNIIS